VRPVHFVYAVRDSIFEDLEVPRDTPDGPDAAPGVWQADRGLSDAATQRTKFFELVVPIVPFITHRSSADLLFDLAAEVDSAISFEAVRVVAKHVTDMRLLRNILNEFRVFHARVLAGGKLGGLTSSGLFALVAYKNTHMKQFELIRVGSSELDVLYRRSRKSSRVGWILRRRRSLRCVSRVRRLQRLMRALSNLALRSRILSNAGFHGYIGVDTLRPIELVEPIGHPPRSVLRASGKRQSTPATLCRSS
jgi:hypothetical protein